jgi:response regulator RpfG family c-di-GMP phosphodiesterase
MMNNIALIDDDISYLESVKKLSEDISKINLIIIDSIPVLSDIKKIIPDKSISALVVDLRMKDQSGLDFLVEVRNYFPKLVLILLTGQLLTKSESEVAEAARIKVFYKSDGSNNVLQNVIKVIEKKKGDDLSIQIPYDTYTSLQETLRPMLLEYADEIKKMYKSKNTRIVTSDSHRPGKENDREKEMEELLSAFINFKPEALKFFQMRMKALEKIAKIRRDIKNNGV